MITHWELFWHIGDIQAVAHWLLTAALSIFFLGLIYRLSQWRLGTTGDPIGNISKRLIILLGTIFSHRTIMKDRYAGFTHLFIFWGSAILFAGHLPVLFHCDWVQNLFGPQIIDLEFPVFLNMVMDAAGLLLIAGIIMGVYRRYLWRPSGFMIKMEDWVVYSLLFLIPVFGFMLKAIRISDDQSIGLFESPTSFLLSSFFALIFSESMRLEVYWVMWLMHLGLAFFLIAYLPFSKLFHFFSASLNIFFNAGETKATLRPLDYDAERFGVKQINDFDWRSLISLDACTECGRCQVACPAHLSEKPLDPMKLIHQLKRQLRKGIFYQIEKQISKPLIDHAVSTAEIWACTTCLNCANQCPVFINPMRLILDIRRNLILNDTRIPPEIEQLYRNFEWFGNAFGMGKINSEPWLHSSEMMTNGNKAADEFVFWVGCQGYFHERNRKTIQAVLNIFQKFDLKYVVLGQDESCCGDLARRTGNEYLFNQLAGNNLKLFDQRGVNKIVTHCPHCLNVFKNEYPQLGGNFEVLHYTEILHQVFNRVSPEIHSEIIRKATFHDPCYLSRYNEIVFEPRRLLKFISGVETVEMKRSKDHTFCCGAGGGCMWLGRQTGLGLNQMRAEEARGTQADLLLTACPYCLNMLEEGVKSFSHKNVMQVLDLAELLDQALK